MFDTSMENKIRINEIAGPISNELAKVNSELKNILSEFDLISEYGILKKSRRNADRLIRHALLLLPVKAMGKSCSDRELPKLCAASEIIFSAVNLHDQITDSDIASRGKKGNITRVNNSRAVLNGDELQTLALLVISEMFPKNLLLDLTRLIEKSCYMKISEEIQKTIFKTEAVYTDSLKSRTSEITSTIALLGAYASKASVDETEILERLGYNLGMLYGIITDQMNGKTSFEGFDPLACAGQYAKEAENIISGFKKSAYKTSLLKLVKLFVKNMKIYSRGRCESEAK